MLDSSTLASADFPRGLVLVVDDEFIQRMILKELLNNLGFDVLLAADGQEALALFESHLPVLVFMDAMMPVMDGFEATQSIKALPAGKLTPIIFLTSLDDPNDLKKCIQAGGDDFISKPANPAILSARIDAAERTRQLYNTLHQQHLELIKHLEFERENELLAHKVFTHAVTSRNQQHPGISVACHSADSFSGDLVLYGSLPGNGLRVLLGDFTGHGLPAAICALPISEVFHTMTLRGYDQTLLLEEINQKLCQLLPDDRFMAAVCVDVDPEKKQLTIWSGGMPASLLLENQVLQALPAQGMPMGILDNYDFGPEQLQLNYSPANRLLLMSDGLQDVRNFQDQQFGKTKDYQNFLSDWQLPGSKLQELVLGALQHHCQQQSLDDDVTLVELDLALISP